MANWVKGKLKIRGKPEDIKRWVEECLHCYFTKWFRDGSYEDELVDDAVVFEHDPKAREMRLDTIEDAYIEGTKRNFVEKGVYGDSYREDEKPILVVSMKAAYFLSIFVVVLPGGAGWMGSGRFSVRPVKVSGGDHARSSAAAV